MKEMKETNGQKTVCVVLSTYNGEEFLRQQLDSVLAQEGVQVKLFVRDDGSSDGTVDILKEYQQKGLLQLHYGEGNVGFAKSFSWLIKNAPKADYYACCDQDDVWLPRKLINGVECLEKQDNSVPQLYFTNHIIVDRNLKEVTQKTTMNYVDDPINRLAENILMNQVSGCVTLFNNKLKEAYSKIPSNLIVVHDYTLNCLASALGQVHFERKPQILYRQHGTNTFGFNGGRFFNLRRALRIFRTFELKSARYHEALNLKYYFYDQLSQENKDFVDMVVTYKFNKKNKKKLRKYMKKCTKFKAARMFCLFLLRFNKF